MLVGNPLHVQEFGVRASRGTARGRPAQLKVVVVFRVGGGRTDQSNLPFEAGNLAFFMAVISVYINGVASG